MQLWRKPAGSLNAKVVKKRRLLLKRFDGRAR